MIYGIKQKAFNNNAIKAITGSLMILGLFIWVMIFSPDHGGLINNSLSDELCIDFINVGEGDAILLTTPQGKVFLIDGGPNVGTEGLSKDDTIMVSDVLINKGIKKLSGVIVTNWHSDHLTGLFPIMRGCSINHIYEPPYKSNGHMFDNYTTLCNNTKISRQTLHAEMLINMGEELFVQILHPEENPPKDLYSEQNDASIVMLIRYGKVQILLTSDIEEDAIRELMKYGDGIKSQIIKIPNHGSEQSYYPAFINAVKANAGIIMTGKTNKFGHPSTKVIQEYEKHGTRIYRTDLHGNIRLLVGGKDENDFRIIVDQKL